jgi:sugar O-acyltransferase (sialic acid O-acetyltransferase NeuD family)
MDKIVTIGGGGHAKVIISLLKKRGDYKIFGYVDVVDKGSILDVPYLGDDSVLSDLLGRNEVSNVVIGIGDTGNASLRMSLIEKAMRMGFSFPAIISPQAVVNEDVTFGEGTVVMDGVVVNSGTKIGRFAIINTRSSIDHDCVIGDFVHIGPGAVLCGGVRVEYNSFIGAGAVVTQYKKIGEQCIIGSGAVVVDDCVSGGLYLGVKAQRTKEIQNR